MRVSSEPDLAAFVRAGDRHRLCAAQLVRLAAHVSRISVIDLDLRRTVFLYGVAGRQRTPVANTLMKMLRAADWSRYAA